MIKVRNVAFVMVPVLLAGCVFSESGFVAPQVKQVKVKNARNPVNQEKRAYHRAVKRMDDSIKVVSSHIHPVESLFKRVVWRLQDLGYLPIQHAFYRGRNGHEYRHDAFLWPVPAALQKAVDQYAWNAQNPFFRGAVIQFERANGFLGARGISEGALHKNVVRSLLSGAAKSDPWPWEWVLVNKADGTDIPERLDIWRHGKGKGLDPCNGLAPCKGVAPCNGWIWHTVVNTGVLGSTPNGTWPIYQRLPQTTMRGVFPVPVSYAVYRTLAGKQVSQWAGSTLKQPARGLVNGYPVRWQPYNDPGIRWVNYFDEGRGIHYYPRASYGFPQSAGCVEEPYRSAPITYKLLHDGVPVTISKAIFQKGRVKNVV